MFSESAEKKFIVLVRNNEFTNLFKKKTIIW